MTFNPGLKIGDELTNNQLQKIFKCGNMGGMRKSKETGTLVIISDKTKPFYHDNWNNGVLLYTGMGKHGDQKLKGNQNITLYESDTNGIGVYLFEVMTKTVYTYRGRVKLAGKPYQTDQPDDEGRVRKVWIFPITPIDSSEELKDPDPVKVAKLSLKELDARSQMVAGPHEPKLSTTPVYYRDPYIKEKVKRIADGKCQLCGKEAPFKDKNGIPYLEEHHVKQLAAGGSDTLDNVVAICPNCHRKIHILNDETDTIILEGIAERNIEAYEILKAYEESR